MSWHPRRPKDTPSKLTPPKPVRDQPPTGPNLPTLPQEIWRKIIAYTVRLAGSHAIELDDYFTLPYENEEHPEIETGLFIDRKSLRLVCRFWRDHVTEICAEYLTIYTAQELKFLVKLFESSEIANPTGKRLGDWTVRIDFKILGPYSVSHVVRLLQCTPNLLIYNNRNGPVDHPEKCTPQEVLKALIIYCAQSLRRVEWSGAGEAPRFQDLVQLCNALPHLITLRLIAIYSFPLQESDGIPPVIHLPKLKTLSLGVIPQPTDYRPEFAVNWDPFVQYTSFRSAQLPALERFECEVFPRFSMNFFDVHGSKLRLFRTAANGAEDVLPEVLSLCPALEVLVIAQVNSPMVFPPFHPWLQKICIVPAIDMAVSVPMRMYGNAVVSPLDHLLKSIESMTTPRLVELRIWNIGAYSGLANHAVFLGFWWRRWNIRGVHFRDKTGSSYYNVHDPDEALLDSVRG
ncbi:hypothetical protein BJ912DRAFT_1066157 [Pholiota molesta]|nr:hypothetical protein BJ912DRAFT_1066157 [Pholiota molesta]